MWEYTEPDWEEFKRVINGDGPCNAERLAVRRMAEEKGRWVRKAIMGQGASYVRPFRIIQYDRKSLNLVTLTFNHMIKLFNLLLALLVVTFAFGQQNIPNGNFEDWGVHQTQVVDNWDVSGNVTSSTDAVKGSKALRLGEYCL